MRNLKNVKNVLIGERRVSKKSGKYFNKESEFVKLTNYTEKQKQEFIAETNKNKTNKFEFVEFNLRTRKGKNEFLVHIIENSTKGSASINYNLKYLYDKIIELMF